MFTKLVNDVSSDSELAQISSDDKRALAITKLLTAEPAAPSRREALIDSEFVSVQRNIKSGDLSVKIDNKVMTDKRLEQLTKLLNSFN